MASHHNAVEFDEIFSPAKLPLSSESSESANNAHAATSIPKLGNSQNIHQLESESSDTDVPPSEATRIVNNALKRQKSRKRFFGQRKGLFISQQADFNVDDYEKKYPDDERGQELGPNARFYRVYIDEHEKHRAELVEGWKDNLDVLLVFAGLFSAVVATIVVEASHGLQPDYALLTTTLLIQQSTILSQMLELQKGIPNNDTSTLAAVSTTFVPPTSTRWVNGLWFTSLALSLATALIAVVAKQWLQAYMTSPVGTPQARGRLLHLRFTSLEKWRVPTIIGLLPFLLHLSLFLFFGGLVIYLVPVDEVIAFVVGLIGLASYLAYLTTMVLSIAIPTCAYKTPLSQLVYGLLHHLTTLAFASFHFLCEEIYHSLYIKWFDDWYEHTEDFLVRLNKARHLSTTLVLREQAILKSPTDFALHVDHQMITWMHSFSFSPSATSITLQALCALPPLEKHLIREQVAVDLCQEVHECLPGDDGMALKRDRLLLTTLSHIRRPLRFSPAITDVGKRVRQIIKAVPYGGLLLHRSTWAVILRHDDAWEFCSSIALLAWCPSRFQAHWCDIADSGNGLCSIRHLMSQTAEICSGQISRQTILKAICYRYSETTNPGTAQVMFKQLANSESKLVESSHIKATAFRAAIGLLYSGSDQMYPTEAIVSSLDELAREFCNALQDYTNGVPDVPDAEVCLDLLEKVYGLSQLMPELHKYVQEQIAQYKSRQRTEALHRSEVELSNSTTLVDRGTGITS